jgi:glycerol-3-phosphate dehydrogenase
MIEECEMQGGNIRYDWPGPGCAASCKISPATFPPNQPFDVAILGAGVIGCALAYELSKYHLRIVLVDRAFDVGEGTSKGNSAIIHTGFDATPGSLEAQLVTSASHQWPELAEKLKIPFRTVSALMLAFNDEQLERLPEIREAAVANGVDDVQLITAEEARRLEPAIAATVRGGLAIPRESIVDPFTTSVAYAEVARENGVAIALGVHVSGISDAAAPVKFVVAQGGFRIPARWVINACGLGSRRLVDAYGGEPMDLNPRRGQFLVFDRDCANLVSRILLPIPTKHTKGMLVAPTIFGNLLAGPTAEDLPPDCTDATSTTCEGLAAVRKAACEMCPELANRSVIATYAGARCNCAQGSYLMRFNDGHPNIVTLSGIRSTGLTASISTAQYVIQRMQIECGLELRPNPAASDFRPETSWPGWFRRPFDNLERVASNPDYGRIICSCENISRGEVRDAMARSPGVTTLDALKRRTRVLTGRCQGFNCCVPIAEMIQQHYQIPLSAVTKCGPGSEFVASGTGRRLEAPAAIPLPGGPMKRHYRVAVIGAGPAGIGTAIGLAQRGIGPVLLIDRAPEIGGVPAWYETKRNGVPTFLVWKRGRVLFGKQFVDLLRARLARTHTELCLESQVIAVSKATKSLTLVSPRQGKLQLRADSIVFACGAREKTLAERGWVSGARPARQFFTLQLLQLVDGCGAIPMERAVILGSDLIAFSAAAKLSAAGIGELSMIDARVRPAARVWERLYFRRWCRLDSYAAVEQVSIAGRLRTTALEFQQHRRECDGIVVSGELVPNSELIEAAGFPVSRPNRLPLVGDDHALPEPGWFIAGAEKGGFHGAYWCYRDGLRAAGRVAKYLQGDATK